MALLLISLFLLFIYAWLIFFYWNSWLDIKEFTIGQNCKLKNPVFITIIIAARNEEENIGHCIKSIIEQTYPGNLFEVMVVDDHSTDSTATIVNSFRRENLHVIKLEDYVGNQKLNSYKKKAVETAIGQAKGSLIVTTDADCVVPPHWLEIIANYHEVTGNVFIVAPVTYRKTAVKGSFFNQLLHVFQTLDFMMLQGITGASVHRNFHNMCNGANLAYEKKVFIEAGGFSGIDEIASGDDMLLMHKIQKLYPDKIGYLKSADVIVQTHPAKNIREFMNQRIRWASKADKYPDKKITGVLVLVYLLNAWIFIIAICSFFYLKVLYLMLLLLGIKTLAELFLLFPVAVFFKKRKLLWWFILCQPFHIIYTLLAGWMGKFGTYSWKGRNVK
jgi:cellulose synthase/poly-beta-1,6-N-acetylglucosamine synthase-like glycosyltransferase